MKKIFKLMTLCSLLFVPATVLSSCGETETTSEQKTDTVPPVGSDEEKTSVPSTDKTFTTQTSDNGLSIDQSHYLFANATEETDSFLYPAEVEILADDTWRHVTALLEDKTTLTAENEAVIPSEALSYEIVTMMDIYGSSGSNEIYSIKVKFDRKLIHVGTTKVQFVTKPSNGSSTIYKDTTICFEVEVKEFGTIPVDHYKVNFTLKTAGMKDLLADKKYQKYEDAYFSVNDEIENPIFGGEALIGKSVDFTEENLSADISFGELKFAKDHVYSLGFTIRYRDDNQRMMLDTYAATFSDMDAVEIVEGGTRTSFKVLKDCTLDISVGDLIQK